MKTLANNRMLLAGLFLATSMPVLASGQDKVPANKQETTNSPKGLRVFFAAHSLLWYAPSPLGELAARQESRTTNW